MSASAYDLIVSVEMVKITRGAFGIRSIIYITVAGTWEMFILKVFIGILFQLFTNNKNYPLKIFLMGYTFARIGLKLGSYEWNINFEYTILVIQKI